MDIFEWLDEEAIKILKEEREDCEAPKSHYTPKPNKMGKLFWFSGKGKNNVLTMAQFLGPIHLPACPGK